MYGRSLCTGITFPRKQIVGGGYNVKSGLILYAVDNPRSKINWTWLRPPSHLRPLRGFPHYSCRVFVDGVKTGEASVPQHMLHQGGTVTQVIESRHPYLSNMDE